VANVVQILITGKNLTSPAFKAAESSALSFGKVVSKIGTASVAAIAGIAYESIKMATTFDSSMTMLQTQAGVSGNQIGWLSDKVLSLAGKVGFDPNSLADALFHIESSFASVGITGPKAMALLETAANGAAVGHANLVDVTNALDAAIASGISGVQDYNQAMGILNATVGSGDMKMQDLADAFGTGMLATVKGFGLSIKDVGAALAVFGDNNIRGAKAGTDLRMAVQALAAPVAKGQELFVKFGMKQGQLADDMRKGGLLTALQDLQDHFDKAGIGADQQGQIITDAFGKKAGVGIAILMGQLDRVKSKYPDLTKGANTFAGAVAKNNETAAQKFKDLNAGLDATLIRIGNKLLPDVIKLLNFVEQHGHIIKELGGWFLVLAAAMKVATVAQAALDLALDDNPIGAIIMLIVILAAVIIKYHTQIWNFIMGFLKWYHNAIESMRLWFFAAFTDIHNFFFNSFTAVVNFIVSLPKKIAGLDMKIFHTVTDALQGIGKWIADHVVDPIINLITSIPSRIGNIGGRIAGAIRSGLGGLGSTLGNLLSGHAGGGIIGAAGGGVRGSLTMVGEHGAELVRLPSGSTVMSNPDSRAFLTSHSGGATTVIIQVGGGGSSDFDNFMLKWLRNTARVKGGGNVQYAFGQ
jgi:TP901 family phage tail tape measure protein